MLHQDLFLYSVNRNILYIHWMETQGHGLLWCLRALSSTECAPGLLNLITPVSTHCQKAEILKTLIEELK